MGIIKAQQKDTALVKEITHSTIKEIYPRYYPAGVVQFFLDYHSTENIEKNVSAGIVYLCTDDEGTVTGTVTVKENEIGRLFVLPRYQGNGYGRELLDFAEGEIAKGYDEIKLDCSLPAKAIYKKRGFTETEYHTVEAADGSCLCYDVMIKQAEKSGR